MTNLARKAFHLSGILIVLVYLGWGVPRWLAALLLAAITLSLGALDLLRHRFPALDARFRLLFSRILDPKDLKGLNGSTLYFLGCTLAVALFPERVACGGILALAVGDPMAAIVGSSVRSPRMGRVSLAGTLACLLFSTVALCEIHRFRPALLGGIAAALLEAVSGSKLDNLSIPVGVALVLHFV